MDNCSKAVFVFPMKFNSDSFNCFKIFCSFFEKDKHHTILKLTTDNGGEYMSKAFEEYLLKDGINHVPGLPHSPELNGVAERTNRTISNLVRCSLLNACLPKSFWADALRHCFFGFNSIPCNTPRVFTTPNSVLDVPEIDVMYTHPFGC